MLAGVERSDDQILVYVVCTTSILYALICAGRSGNARRQTGLVAHSVAHTQQPVATMARHASKLPRGGLDP